MNIQWNRCHVRNLLVCTSTKIWTENVIQKICKKTASPFNISIHVYDSLVQPYLHYGIVVWGNCGSGLSEMLQKLQNRAAGTLMNANYDSNID